MGIKDYLKHLNQEEITNIIEYEHVYLDCNYLIHFLIYKCKNDKELYGKICNFWKNLMEVIKIKSTVHLIYDGEHNNEELLTNPKLQTLILRYKDKVASIDYDKQVIKPGSQILNTFKYYLVDVIEKNKKINKSKFVINQNDDQIKGEADLKILNLIYNSNQNNVCICSKDSDMILIAHSLAINKSMKIVYIDTFKKYNLDYVLIVLLLGNDYLPKITSITYNTVINTYEKYIKYNKPIIFNGNVNYVNLIEFITYFIVNGSNKKIKFNFNNFGPIRFETYINNLIWCLGHYKVINNNFNYIQEISNNDDDVKLKHTINICNFINHSYL